MPTGALVRHRSGRDTPTPQILPATPHRPWGYALPFVTRARYLQRMHNVPSSLVSPCIADILLVHIDSLTGPRVSDIVVGD